MTSRTNPEIVGEPVSATVAKRPERTTLDGRVVSVVPLDPVAHAGTLYEAVRGEENAGLWLYVRGAICDSRCL
jgi:hypothetical protein